MLIYRASHRPPPAPARLTMAEDLARPASLGAAIELDQLRLFYQPIVDLRTTTVIGHEVFIRWQHPRYGLLSPVDFLPAIDRDTGLSRTLGSWVLHKAGAVLNEWKVSVNISPLHLADAAFANQVSEMLDRTGSAPSRLIFELTAPSVVWPSDTVIATCRTLADLGITFAVDEIGLHQPSLKTLDGLPIDLLKIDRSVAGEIGIDPRAEAAIVSTIALATESGRRTVAVGVETPDQAEFLRKHGATYAQGYLFGRPQPR